jgi:hypothetical protein
MKWQETVEDCMVRNFITCTLHQMLIKSGRWAGHVACIGEMRNAYKILVGKPAGKSYSEDLDVDGRIVLEWVLWKQGGKVCTGFIWLRIGACGGLL